MTAQSSYEVNFDGLIGPTHNFAGLSFGNVASTSNTGRVSNPRRGALQGLKKMRKLHDLGYKQGVLPPLYRPDFEKLKNLGFTGSKTKILQLLSKESPEMIAAFFSASSMWTANAGTVGPSPDTSDGKVHFTPANLINKLHRSLEPQSTAIVLRAIFADQNKFVVHDPLHPHPSFGDEGAANHTRFCEDYNKPGIQFFVYGKHAFGRGHAEPTRFPARHTFEASHAVARLHGLDPSKVVFAQQNPAAIDAGAFHNDVVSVGNRNLLFYHESAFHKEAETIAELREKFAKVSSSNFNALRVSHAEVPLGDVIKSYLFNSQLLALPSGDTLLVCPIECEETKTVNAYLKNLTSRSDSPIKKIEYFDLRESMLNGGGPACLRLRVALTSAELNAINQGVLLTDELFQKLEVWVNKNYREELATSDLCEPKFIDEVESALDELTRILKVGNIYQFQN